MTEKLKAIHGREVLPDSVQESMARQRTACSGIWPQKSRKTEPKNPIPAGSARKNY
jgi:hypothetical protein